MVANHKRIKGPMENLAQLQPQSSGFVAANEPQQRAICDYLVDAGKLDPPNVERALRLQLEQNHWEKIGLILVKLGLASEQDVAECLAEQLDVRLVKHQDFPDEYSSVNPISANFLKANKFLVLDENDTELTVVMADPGDQFTHDAIRLFSGKKIVACLGLQRPLSSWLATLFAGQRNPALQIFTSNRLTGS